MLLVRGGQALRADPSPSTPHHTRHVATIHDRILLGAKHDFKRSLSLDLCADHLSPFATSTVLVADCESSEPVLQFGWQTPRSGHPVEYAGMAHTPCFLQRGDLTDVQVQPADVVVQIDRTDWAAAMEEAHSQQPAPTRPLW